MKPINFSVETVAASRPCGSVTEMRTAATAATRTHVVRKNTQLSLSNANNLKCEGLRLMHVARFFQLRITEVNGFQMSQTIIDYYSLNLNIQVIRPLHMSGNVIYLCHTQILICSLDEDLLNIANARFCKLAKVYLRKFNSLTSVHHHSGNDRDGV